MRLRWTPTAHAELNAIGERIAQGNPDAAIRVIGKIESRAESLIQFPAIGRVGRVPGTHELVIPDTPYVVAYAISDQDVWVLTVKHEAREWPESLV